jgi:integrase/recombinase XerD
MLPKVLSVQEVDRMLRSLANIKHICLLACIYGHGLRLEEVRNVKMDDINWDRNQIFVDKGKGKKERYVNLSQQFKEILQVYVHQFKPIHYLFEGQDIINQYSGRSIQNVVKKATSIAGITQKVSPHTLRHCFAIHLLDAGTQLPYIKELLGHKDIKTTMIYTHITTSSIEKVVSPLDKLRIFGNENLEKTQL